MRDRWMKIAFAGSLALNVLVAGVVIGGLVAHDRRAPPPPPGREMMLGPLGGAFSRAERAAILRQAETAGVDLGAMRDDFLRNIGGLADALEARPFDAGAVRALLARMREAGDMRIRAGENLMLERFGVMDDAQRRAYAERLRAAAARFGAPPDAPPPEDAPPSAAGGAG